MLDEVLRRLPESYLEFYEAISEVIPKERIYTDPLHTLCYGHDASFYKLIPKIVVVCDNSDEIAEVLFLSDKLMLPIVFRAAGTSLSGQSVGDGILVITSRDKRGVKVNSDGSLVTLQSSATGSYANFHLKKFRKKIGPDPASIDACSVGGIVANNASGMCCGVEQNSYNTVYGMKIILQDGTLLDTTDEFSKKEFLKSHKELCDKLLFLKMMVEDDEELKALIRRKYSIKNTCGYSINALVDFDDPIDMILHLMVGSEGTLGYIDEITYKTVDDPQFKATSLMLFSDIKIAANAVQRLKTLPRSEVLTAELMDRAALRSVQDKEGMEFLKELDDNVCAVLVDTVSTDEQNIKKQIQKIIELLKGLTTVEPITFSEDKHTRERYWAVRRGLFTAVSSMRKIGTTCIIEDIAFPMDKLDSAVLKLQELFKKYGYDDAIIFGHSLDSNLHFVFNQDFSKEEEVKRYANFMKEITDVIAVDYKGSLKAEHGTGRNMAPFVEMEWGKKAYEIMKEIKKIFDPKDLLNPGVLINEDSDIYIKNLKPLPKSDELIDKCIECGFCEPNCPSNALTLTPRQRIVANREISLLENSQKDEETLKSLKELYEYDGLDTCAACSLCSLSCPVGIDTAKLTKKLRSKRLSKNEKNIAHKIADNYDKTLKAVKIALSLNSFAKGLFGEKFMQKSMDFIRDVTNGKTPKWTPYLPKASKFDEDKLMVNKSDEKVVYFPSCLCRTFGKKGDEELELYEVINNLINRAGYEIILPKNVNRLCCGTPMSSKGFKEEAKRQSDELEEALFEASNGGEYPILCETSPCVKAMIENFEKKMEILEPVEFTLKYLAPKLTFKPIEETIAIHSTCSTTKMGLKDDLIKLAKMCAKEVIVPPNVTCCGFAGDRGFSYPELNASALRWLKHDLGNNAKRGYSTSITCEIGLSKHGGIDYKSIFYLVDKCAR